MLLRRIEDYLHGPPPLLKVRRAGEQRGALDRLFGGRELPVAYPHLLFELHDIPEEVGTLLRVQACHVEEKPQNRLPFVGEEVIPLAELLIDEGKEGQRKAFQQAFPQGVLNFLRQPLLDAHDTYPLTSKLPQHFALRIQRRATQQARERRAKINVTNGTI